MGGQQLEFGDFKLSTAMKRTKRERFLAEVEMVVPWQVLIDPIEPHYPKTSTKVDGLPMRWPPCGVLQASTWS